MTAPEQHGHTAEHAAHAAQSAFPPFNPTYFASQLFWLAITFAVLYLLLSKWVLPRIGSAIEERRDRIADDLDAAASMKSQADEAVRNYEQALAEARTKAHGLAGDAKAQVDAKIAEETAEVDAKLDAQASEAEARILAAKDKALAEVDTIAAQTAIAISTHLTQLDIAEADAQKAVAKAKQGA